jgi:glyoxylase-like metal-dependent hydrolase (beta-lactamase superfamily II)
MFVRLDIGKDRRLSKFEIISKGKNSGVDTILRYKTAQGTEIFCLGVPLSYESEEDWDLGPTWCYVIMKAPVTLIDTGQWGKFDALKALLEKAGISLGQIKRVIVTHGHEDHDGNLPEIVDASGAEIWGHVAYENMISYHTDIDDGASHPRFPGSCRTCALPDTFNKSCIPYQQKRSRMKQGYKIDKNDGDMAGDYRFISTPGHSPDSVCIVFEEDVVFSGDTLLPSITPHPSLMLEYYVQRRILPEKYGNANESYGLMAFIASLREIKDKCKNIEALMPGHRLIEKGEINCLQPSERAAEIIDFHEERCKNILSTLDNKSLSLEEISISLFPPRLRKGKGILLAQREVMSHLELLAIHGDVEWVDGHSFKSKRTGSNNYRKYFERRDQ